jgi:hypothetical protein
LNRAFTDELAGKGPLTKGTNLSLTKVGFQVRLTNVRSFMELSRSTEIARLRGSLPMNLVPIAHRLLIWPALAAVVFCAACSAESSKGETLEVPDSGQDPSNTGGAISGDGGSGGNGGSGGSGYGGNVVVYYESDAGEDPFGLGGSGSELCVGVKVDPVPITIDETIQIKELIETIEPIAIYIMLDKSGSMNDIVTGEVSKWDMAVESISTFVNDSDSEGLKVTLQYFPIVDGACDGTGFDTPAVVMGELPDIADEIEASLNETAPDGYTPIEGALRGLTSFCIDYQEDNPDEKCIGVLVTDGEPRNGQGYTCTLEYDPIANIAADAYNNHEVKTFTVGMEDEGFALLEQIAQESLTDCYPDEPPDYSACDIRADANLLEALEAIRETVTVVTSREVTREVTQTKIQECEFGIPDPPEDEIFDPELVNVIFSERGEPDRTIGMVPEESDCEKLTDGWGWYYVYDENDEPAKINVCPETCEFITSVEAGRIDIQFGCKTEMPLI